MGNRKFILLGISAVVMLSLSLVSIPEALAVGLKVYVKMSHSNNGSTKVCVTSLYQNLPCGTVSLSGLASPHTYGPFIFGENLVPVGGQFNVCVTNLANNQYRCVAGSNSPAKAPEYVSLTVPTGTSSSTNRQNLFNDLNMCKAIEKYLVNKCSTYVNAYGTLSVEGKRAKDCISNGIMLAGLGVVSALPPLMITGILKPLSENTNCGGIANWGLIEADATNALAFLKILGIL